MRRDAPLCPVGHLPLKGGDRQKATLASTVSLWRKANLKRIGILELGDARDGAAIQSPPLRGRCPTGQRGVFGTTEGYVA